MSGFTVGKAPYKKRIAKRTGRGLSAAAKRARVAGMSSYYVGPLGAGAVVPGYTRTVGAYRRAAPWSVEKKFFETSIVNTADVSGGVVLNSLCLIPQGTTDQTRIGNKITIKNINLRGYASNDDVAGAAYGGGHIRIILYIDKQANGATAGVTDILKTTNGIASFRNMDQVDRFVILKDKVVKVPILSTNALHTGTDNKIWKMNIKCNIVVHYSSTVGAITELRSNNIGLLYIADKATINAAEIGLARVKFTDD